MTGFKYTAADSSCNFTSLIAKEVLLHIRSQMRFIDFKGCGCMQTGSSNQQYQKGDQQMQQHPQDQQYGQGQQYSQSSIPVAEPVQGQPAQYPKATQPPIQRHVNGDVV